MAERGDLTVLHEPFCNLKDYGETDAGGRTFDSPALLLDWLRDEAQRGDVFLKDTMDHQHDEVLTDRRFLAEARHAFLIRSPEEIAASYYALFPPMTINAIGMERLCEMQSAIINAGGNPPVIIDSDDLLTRPAATIAAYCAAVGLAFNPRALTWARGEQPEWRRTARWHTDASNSSGFERRKREYPQTVENSEKLAQYAAHHRPFYEQLYAQRIDVSP
jgi:Sulfotransferase domain